MKTRTKHLIILGLIFCFQINTFAQTNSTDKMQWFNDAKLGIFIHWGIYAVDGTVESWAFKQGDIPYDKYMAQAKRFTASKYDPNEWAKLFKEAGAKYAVLTAKHHDGFALWGTKQNKLNSVQGSPAGRDLVSPYCDAMRKEGIKAGLYFSHLDWSHPDYATITRKDMIFENGRNHFSFPKKGEDNIFRWEKFLQFHRAQIKELAIGYKPDLFWFDGTWEREEHFWKMKELRDSILKWQPTVILNSRMLGYGDYETPERGIPITQPEEKWELCMTINDSWGYRPVDTNYKSPREIIQIFVDVIALGGNLLLDVGPKEDGTIPDEQIFVLKELGKWIRTHEEAVYPTQAGLPYGHFNGPTTLSKDKKTLYLYVYDAPREFLTLKGIRSKISNIRVVGTAEKLAYKKSSGSPMAEIPGIIRINTPNKIDEYATVIAVEFVEPIDVYRGPGYKKYIPCEN